LDLPGFTLPPLYARQLAEQVERLAGPHVVAAWLGEQALARTALDEPSFTLSFEAFESLVLRAPEMTNEPAFGLLVGERLVATTHGMLGYAALNSGTVRAALELVERFIQVRFSLLSLSLRTRGEWLEVRFVETRPLGALARPVLESVMVSVKQVLVALARGVCPLASVSFPFATPPYAELSRELFGCEVRYEAKWAGFTLPLSGVDVPLKTADPEAFREAAAICERELDKLVSQRTLADRVRRLLLERPQGFPSLAAIARALHVTPRTLHRRLLEEDTSYRALLEEIRLTLAREHLRSTHFSIEEIAFTLGYTDLANFRRAFKRWTGQSPSTYRAALPEAEPAARRSS
jgi:AraC-like DNA-binding protein